MLTPFSVLLVLAAAFMHASWNALLRGGADRAQSMLIMNITVGVIGLGGLGHMGVKLARAMGAHVTMITTSPSKAADAKKLGAHEVIISTDAAQMKAAGKSFDLLLNTVSASHDYNAYQRLLRVDGAQVLHTFL